MAEMVEEARNHIEAQIENTDTPVGRVGAICLNWLEYSSEAATLLMAEGKTLKGALGAMRNYANKNRDKEKSFVVDPMQAMIQILEYFGHEDPIGLVEGGFAYFCLQKEMEKMRPANTPAASDLPQTMESAPVAATAPAPKPKKAVTLNLEDLGL